MRKQQPRRGRRRAAARPRGRTPGAAPAGPGRPARSRTRGSSRRPCQHWGTLHGGAPDAPSTWWRWTTPEAPPLRASRPWRWTACTQLYRRGAEHRPARRAWRSLDRRSDSASASGCSRTCSDQPTLVGRAVAAAAAAPARRSPSAETGTPAGRHRPRRTPTPALPLRRLRLRSAALFLAVPGLPGLGHLPAATPGGPLMTAPTQPRTTRPGPGAGGGRRDARPLLVRRGRPHLARGPVPVVRVNREEERLGGAANVALNVKTLGAQATLLTVVGDDEAGTQARRR